MKKYLPVIIGALFGLLFCMNTQSGMSDENQPQSNETPETITVRPVESNAAFRNPLKGFRVSMEGKLPKHEYATLARCYIKWNDLENDESDTIEKIRTYCDKRWAGLESSDIKVIPRVYLDWDKKPNNEYWPADMTTGDYDSDQFKKRVTRLIARLGECWDNDPRIAWIQMGLIGFWGEHHSPAPSEEMQKLLGNAFKKAFKNKKILVRHADEFNDGEFGIYWDSWAHAQQMNSRKHGGGLLKLNQAKKRYLIAPIEGETAYNWGKYTVQPGDNPNDTLSDPVHRKYLLDSIRLLHCTALGWVANYDATKPDVHAGAEEVQKAFGYGSAGVLPGALLTITSHHQIPRDKIVKSLLVAGGFGEIIAMRASLSGSSHGCQAENGSASAITAAALLYAFDQDLACIESGAAFALKNLLGLVCDPVGGLVEVPCVKRNVVASVNAVACAEMALSGIRTVIPFDEIVNAMDQIGKDMPSSLKETSLGGLALCPSVKNQIK